MKAKSLAKLAACIALIVCAMLVTACKGVTIAPGDGGSVTVTPIEPGDSSTGNQGGNQGNVTDHIHIYKFDESSNVTYDCTVGGIKIWKCACGDVKQEQVAPMQHQLRMYDGKAPDCITSGYNAYVECINSNCTYTTYEEAAPLGHQLQHYDYKAATCTEFGWEAYDVCSRCSYSTYKKIEANGHSFSNGFCSCGREDLWLHEHIWDNGVVTPATCTTVGFAKYTCTDSRCGDTKTDEIPATGHTITNHSAKAATCTEGGWYSYEVCDTCDYTTYVSAPALGHNVREVSGMEATCMTDGYTDYEVCTRAGCNGDGLKKKTVVPALGHDIKHLADVAPTCTAIGLENRSECQREGCNYSTETKVSALGHELQSVAGKVATCTMDGYYPYDKCTRGGCSYSTYEMIPALGHDDVMYEEKAPTCTDFGWNAYSVCQRCTRSTYAQLNSLGHNLVNGYCDREGCEYYDDGEHTHIWSYGYITTQPTCVATGVKKFECTDENCGDTKTESEPALGHNNIHYNEKEATCVADGWQAYDECQRCGYNTYVKIPAKGHTYAGAIISQPTCTTNGIRRYTCSCGVSYDIEIEKLGHEWGGWFIFKDATCTASGQEQRICMNNPAHIDYRSTAPLGHEWGDYIVTTLATCTTRGEQKRYCIRDASHIDVPILIPVISHNVNSQGICTICGDQINSPLSTPSVTTMSGYTLFWDAVNGAVSYELRIICNGTETTVPVSATNFNLESYFINCSSIDLYIRAMAAEGSKTAHSLWGENKLEIPEGTIVDHGGIGQAVNLLTGPYTDFENGAKLSIFNEHVFNRLDADDYSGQTPKHHTDTIYSESIREYTNILTEKNTNKLSVDASVGVSKLVKVTAGYSYEVGSSYEKKTYNNTQAVFYDINYTYTGYQTGIKSYIANLFAMDKDKRDEALLTLTSESFRADAKKLQDGYMTPAEFIALYGTHIITEAVYGASFKAHYEYLSDKSTAEGTFGENVKNTITAGITGSIKGVEFGLSTTNVNEKVLSAFTSNTSSDVYSKFTFDALGGKQPANMASLSFTEFSQVCDVWVNNIKNEDDYALIDIPDGSLYFVWDFLGEEYSEAKALLANYFYATCDEQYKLNNSKINGMFQDFFDFDDETGTLLIDLSARQNPNSENVSLAGTAEYKDGSSVIFNGTKFTIYPKFNGKEVKKVVFKGGYMTRDYLTDQLITNYFTNLRITFDDDWNKDIVVEFQNFGYDAPAGYSGLDFSAVSSENITIIVSGNTYIKGGDGTSAGATGYIGINATGKNLTIDGTGALKVYGGNGKNGTNETTTGKCERGPTGGTGGAGGIAIETDKLIVYTEVTINGGRGGNGGNGGNGWSGSGVGDSHGGHGGSGGNGGYAIRAEEIVIKANGNLTVTGGTGGNGGNGGKGDKYGVDDAWGGDGGRGGNGGCSYNSSCAIIDEGGSASFIPGAGGSGGSGGAGDGADGGSGGSYGPGSSGER